MIGSTGPHRPCGRTPWRLAAVGVAVTMVLAAPGVASAQTNHRAGGVRSWVTDLSTSQRLDEQPRQHWSSGRAPQGTVITVDPTRRYQSMAGFGASMTDSSAYVLSQLPSRQRTKIMRELFSDAGIGLSMLRNPMGASDFARSIYSYDDQPAGRTDPRLREFSITHDKAYIIPRIAEAKRLNPELVTMATPWSPPGWMKSSDSMVQGTLKERYYAAYAQYFTKFLTGYARAGVPVDFVSAQNEPLYAPADYPGMYFGPDEAAEFIGDYLGPAIRRSGQKTQILGYDHNWDVTAYPEQMYADPRAVDDVAGTAWHCYGGDVTAQSISHNNYPQAPAYLTECSGGTWQGTDAEAFELTMSLMIGVPRNWGQSVVLWNLALDGARGPYVGGCTTCRGVVTVNDDGTVDKELEFWALGQTSRFVQPGAVRVASSQPAQGTGGQGLMDVAYINPDGSGVLVAYNAASTTKRFSIKVGNRYVTTSLAAGAAGTYTWTDPGRTVQAKQADLGWVDLDLGRGPKGTPTERLVQSVSPAVIAGMNQVQLGGQWLAYSLPYGAELHAGTATRLDRAGWKVTTYCGEEIATCPEDASPVANMLDGDPDTRWSSGTGQVPGMYVQADLGSPITFSQVQLDVGSSTGDYLRTYEVQTSADGDTWTPIARGQGSTGEMTIALPSTTARYLRIVSDASSGSWWSVGELNLANAPGVNQSPSGQVRTDTGRLPDGTVVMGTYNAGRRDAVVAFPIDGFAYSYLLPPRAAVTFAVWPG